MKENGDEKKTAGRPGKAKASARGAKQFSQLAAVAGLKVADPDKNPVVRLGPDLSAVAKSLGAVVSRLDVYEVPDSGELVFFNRHGQRQEMDPRTFRTWISDYVTVAARFDKESGDALPCTMDMDAAATILKSEFFRRGVRPLTGTHLVRLPVIRADGSLEALPWGYDEQTGIYTVPGGLEYDFDMSVESANAWFERTYCGFPMADARSRAVQALALISVFIRTLPGGSSLRPGIIWLANKPETGKSVLAKAAQYPVFGRVPSTKMKRAEDLDKEIEALVRAQVPNIFLDNVYEKMESATLDQLLTSEEVRFRALGGHDVVTARNVAQIFVTGNNLKLNTDAQRRFLIVDLFETGEATERAIPEDGLLNDDAMKRPEWRARMLAMCWAWVRHWHEQGCPRGTHRMGSFEDFSLMGGGIIECAGFHPPCERAEIPDAINPERQEFAELLVGVLEEMGEEISREFSLQEMCRIARARGLYEQQIGTQLDGIRMTVKEDKIPKEHASIAEDLGYMNDSQRSRFGWRLKKEVGQVPLVRGRRVQFGKRSQARKSTWSIRILD